MQVPKYTLRALLFHDVLDPLPELLLMGFGHLEVHVNRVVCLTEAVVNIRPTPPLFGAVTSARRSRSPTLRVSQYRTDWGSTRREAPEPSAPAPRSTPLPDGLHS